MAVLRSLTHPNPERLATMSGMTRFWQKLPLEVQQAIFSAFIDLLLLDYETEADFRKEIRNVSLVSKVWMASLEHPVRTKLELCQRRLGEATTAQKVAQKALSDRWKVPTMSLNDVRQMLEAERSREDRSTTEPTQEEVAQLFTALCRSRQTVPFEHALILRTGYKFWKR